MMVTQSKATAYLILLTVGNMILGGLMVAEVVPVYIGMILCFLWAGAVVWHSICNLMPGEKPWNRPRWEIHEANRNNEEWRRGYRNTD